MPRPIRQNYRQLAAELVHHGPRPRPRHARQLRDFHSRQRALVPELPDNQSDSFSWDQFVIELHSEPLIHQIAQNGYVGYKCREFL